jgi:hypothetical protein
LKFAKTGLPLPPSAVARAEASEAALVLLVVHQPLACVVVSVVALRVVLLAG